MCTYTSIYVCIMVMVSRIILVSLGFRNWISPFFYFVLFLLLRRRSCNFFSSVALFKTQLNCNIIFVFFFLFYKYLLIPIAFYVYTNNLAGCVLSVHSCSALSNTKDCNTFFFLRLFSLFLLLFYFQFCFLSLICFLLLFLMKFDLVAAVFFFFFFYSSVVVEYLKKSNRCQT